MGVVADMSKIIGMTNAGIVAIAIIVYFFKRQAKRTIYKAELMPSISNRKMRFYEKYVKRVIDVICSIGALIILSPVYAIVAILVKLRLGSPIIFTQDRPGIVGSDGKETVFKLYKFRTMTDEKDANGNLLSDEKRLTSFGVWLRKTSLDEIPEVLNILNGTMTIVGPRPQLVRDMVFMTKEQRARHTAKPGLTGLAQVNGRNAISWEQKIDWDLEYIKNVTLLTDVKIFFKTIEKALFKQEGITGEEMATAEDYGDYLLKTENIKTDEYEAKQLLARKILEGSIEEESIDGLVSVIMPSYNTADYINIAIQSVQEQTYKNWELIVVDDCSTDNTDKILLKISDERIRVLKNETNLGAAASRNRALREAKGQWIAYLDSDDIWSPQKLEKQIAFMKENDYHFSYTRYEEIDSYGLPTNIIVSGPKHITRTGMFNYCWPGCLTVMYDAKKIGLIQIEDIKKNNDYAMWLKICKKQDCYLLDECLGQYRRGRVGSISTSSLKNMIVWHYKLFRDAEKQSRISSFLNTIRNLFFGCYKKIRYVKRK